MKYHKTKRAKYPVTFLLTALLACQPISAYAVTFADINQVPWAGAEKSIQKAADLGLMVGEQNTKGQTIFRPKDSVSLCETAQLAYKLMTTTGKMSTSSSVTQKWTSVLQVYSIPTWAYTAVSHCLEEGIVSISELSGYMKNGSTLSATREQSAKILGRALTASVSSYTANNSTTKFADNNSISSDARPYVAVLNQAGIVNGDNVNKFNPKNTLNRSEMAVMVTNLYSVLANTSSSTTTSQTTTTSTKSGTAAALTNFYVNFENSNAYYLYTSSSIPATLNGESTTISKLATMFLNGTEMEATVTLNSSNRVTKLAVETDDAKDVDGDEVTGEITSLSNTRIKIDDKSYDIEDKNDLIIKINGDTADFNELMDLYNDEDELEATITLDDDEYVVKIVVEDGGSSSSSSDTVEGDIESLTKTKIKIDGDSYNIKNSSKVTVKINGSTKSFDKLMDIYEDDYDIEATITLDEDDYVTKIVAEYDEDDVDYDVKGEVTDLSDDEIEIDDDDTYEIDDWTEIKIDGKSEDLSDLLEEYEDLKDDEYFEASLVLDEDDDDYVTELYLTTKVDDDDDEDEVEGEIKDVDDDSIKIGSKTYDLDSSVDIDIENGSYDIDNIDDLIEAIDLGFVIEVTATVDDDEVTDIVGEVTEARGILYDYDEDTIEIDTEGYWDDDADPIEYDFDDEDVASDLDDDLDDEDLDYEDDEVEVILTLKNGKVTKVELD